MNGITVTAHQNGVNVISATPKPVSVVTTASKPVNVTARTGPQGPPGPPGPSGTPALWDSMTQQEFDALPTKDPQVLYIIVP